MRVGIIGTGKPKGEEGRTGAAMAYEHAAGYRLLGDACDIAAVADIVQENAEFFARAFDVPRTYLDYREMLAEEGLDMVSICTWPHLHEQMTVDCAEAGVRAVHCEKPMATTWGGCKRMVEACRRHGVQLTFNHMRRFAEPMRKAKELLDAGEIGELLRLEFGRYNLCDYGSHQFDICGFFNDQAPALWVIAQVDYRRRRKVFGMDQENQAVALWLYSNGVQGLALTAGRDLPALAPHNRLVGTEGVIDLEPPGGPILRVRRKGAGEWETIEFAPGVNVHGPGAHERAIAHAVECLETGQTPQIGADSALQATELIFASWESARTRGRVDLPLQIDDNPLVAMVESGALNPVEPQQ